MFSRKLPLYVSFWKQSGLEIYPRDYQIDWHSFYAQNRLTTIWSNNPVLALELTDWWLPGGSPRSSEAEWTVYFHNRSYDPFMMGWATKQSHPPFTFNIHPPQKHQKDINLVRRKPTPSVPRHTPWTFSSPQWKGGGGCPCRNHSGSWTVCWALNLVVLAKYISNIKQQHGMLWIYGTL